MDKKGSISFRTDMADEAHKLYFEEASQNSDTTGVSICRSSIFGFDLCEIEITNEEAQQSLGKAPGKYYSLSLPESFDKGSDVFSKASSAVAALIKRCFFDIQSTVLVAALGNPDITPDALGNLAASNILVTAHLSKSEFPQFSSLSLLRPGVLGTSGIESSRQIKAICDLIKPTAVIVIDALAGAEPERLCRCIQISDAGISPGSGVGNMRPEISRKTLGVPVISIGMPTVIDAANFGFDTVEGMFVTPQNIDSLVRNAARLIGYGINLAVHKNICLEEIDYLLG